MRIVLIILNAFLGVTAVVGGLGIVLNWFALPTESLRGSPFSSYLIPGLVLLVVVGGSGLVAAGAVLRRHPLAAPASYVTGLLIMGYEIVQAAVIGLSWLQVFYFIVGLLIIALAERS